MAAGGWRVWPAGSGWGAGSRWGAWRVRVGDGGWRVADSRSWLEVVGC